MYIIHEHRIVPGQYLGRNKKEAAYDVVSYTHALLKMGISKKNT